MNFNGFCGKGRATWDKSACRYTTTADPLVYPDAPQHRPFHSAAMARVTACSSSIRNAFCDVDSRSAWTRINIEPARIGPFAAANESTSGRSRRRQRLRTTAVPTVFGIANPTINACAENWRVTTTLTRRDRPTTPFRRRSAKADLPDNEFIPAPATDSRPRFSLDLSTDANATRHDPHAWTSDGEIRAFWHACGRLVEMFSSRGAFLSVKRHRKSANETEQPDLRTLRIDA